MSRKSLWWRSLLVLTCSCTNDSLLKSNHLIFTATLTTQKRGSTHKHTKDFFPFQSLWQTSTWPPQLCQIKWRLWRGTSHRLYARRCVFQSLVWKVSAHTEQSYVLRYKAVTLSNFIWALFWGGIKHESLITSIVQLYESDDCNVHRQRFCQGNDYEIRPCHCVARAQKTVNA